MQSRHLPGMQPQLVSSTHLSVRGAWLGEREVPVTAVAEQTTPDQKDKGEKKQKTKTKSFEINRTVPVGGL